MLERKWKTHKIICVYTRFENEKEKLIKEAV